MVEYVRDGMSKSMNVNPIVDCSEYGLVMGVNAIIITLGNVVDVNAMKLTHSWRYSMHNLMRLTMRDKTNDSK